MITRRRFLYHPVWAGESGLRHQGVHPSEPPAADSFLLLRGSEENLQPDGERLVSTLRSVGAVQSPGPGAGGSGWTREEAERPVRRRVAVPKHFSSQVDHNWTMVGGGVHLLQNPHGDRGTFIVIFKGTATGVLCMCGDINVCRVGKKK